MNDRHAAPVPDDEQEVDLASAWERIKVRWWLPVGGLVLGAVVGIALALAGGNVYRAETIVYLGQPFAPQGGGQIQSLATNPRTVSEIVRSEAVLRDVSDATGIPVSQLRSSISTNELVAAGQPRATVTPLIEIAVKGDAEPRRIEEATDALAARVVQNVSSFVLEKIELLEGQIEVSQTQLAEIRSRIARAEADQRRITNDESIPLDIRLLLSSNLNSVITTADARRAALQDNLFEAQQFLNLAEDVESSRVVEEASAVKTTARSRRTSVLVGALVGLLVGTIAALAAEPFAARRRRTAPAAVS
jgi:uncharacterized protein involved in exopolysaccharide biosynthesis